MKEMVIFSVPQSFGGGEVFQIKLAALLRERVRLTVISPPLAPLQKGLAAWGGRFIELPATGGLALRLAFALWLWRQRGLLRATRAVIVLNGRGAAYSAPLVRWLVGIGPVLICHTELSLRRGDIKEWLYGLAARHARRVVTVSEAVATQHRQRWPALPVRAIPNWIDRTGTTPLAPSVAHAPMRLAVVGRLAPGKGIDDVVVACSELPNIELHVYGDGPLRAQLDAMRSSRLWLHLHGHVDEVQQILPKHSILVSGSYSESFSYSVAEGIQAGLLCVLSELPAHRELLGPDYPNDLFFQPGNIGALRNALNAAHSLLSTDDGAAARIIAQARVRLRLRNAPEVAGRAYMAALFDVQDAAVQGFY